jgi:hypothetical protein
MSEHKLRVLFDSEYQEKYENYEKFLKSNREWYFEYIKSSRGVPNIIVMVFSFALLSLLVRGQVLVGLGMGILTGLAVPFLVVMSENRKQAKELGLKSVRLW